MARQLKRSFHLTFQKIHEEEIVFIAGKSESEQVFDAKHGDHEENHRREEPHELDQTLGHSVWKEEISCVITIFQIFFKLFFHDSFY